MCEIPRKWLAGSTGLEPLNGNFSNAVMARDFGHKGLKLSHLTAGVSYSEVLGSSPDSTPVMETFWRRAMEEVEHAVERTRVIVGIASLCYAPVLSRALPA